MLRTLLLAAVFATLFHGDAIALDSCVVPNGQTYTINEHSTCRRVTNGHASGSSVMVPTKTAAEWSSGANAFINATPTGVTVGTCNACGDTGNCVASGSGGGGYPTGCNTIGQTCADGSIYVGPHPTEAGVRLYTTPAAQSTSAEWHADSTGALSIAGATNLTNGITNQNAIFAAASTAWTHANSFAKFEPARECYILTAHGANDWYLPSVKELDTMYANLVVAPPGTGDPDNPTASGSVAAGQGATDATRDGPYASSFATDYHWSSTQNTASAAWIVNGLDGEIRSNSKDNKEDVRCIRRATASSCPPDLGDVTPTVTCPANISGAAKSTQYTTTFSPTGFTGPMDLWVSTRVDTSSPAENGGVQINGGAWITSGNGPISINPGDTITLRITTRSISNALRGFLIRMGTVSCTWSVTTG